MTNNILVGILLGLGCAAWVYAKLIRSSGGNAKNSLIVASAVGAAAMVIMIMILGSINK